MNTKLPPVHPGEVLLEDFLKPLNITPHRLSASIHVPPIRISEIVRGMRSISANTALRLARYFGTSPQFWMNLQTHYDLEIERDHNWTKTERMIQPLQIAA
ncbi:MAG: HigA family addiction module antitoxin [Verrucomicrobiae bacterium]|nr:HigA family addiction module antitoxin [Verrucomicrobiae bacterium]